MFVRLFLFQRKTQKIAIDLSKQQALDADTGAIQQINFTANLERSEDATMFCIIEKAKETVGRNRKNL